MIIKSKTRKDKSFGALVQYILRESARGGISKEEAKHSMDDTDERLFTLLHNFGDEVMPDDLDGISSDFVNNSKYLRERKNGVMMYHEIASFAPVDASKIDAFMLEDIARKYVETRAPNGLALARPHFDKDHVHIHFLISGNELGNGNRLRISKEEFQEQRRAIEEYQLEQYPQLSQSYVHSRDKEKYKQQRQERISDRRREMEKRGAKQTVKEKLSNEIQQAVVDVPNMDSLVKDVQKRGYETYERGGVPYGIIHNGKRYRFTTLLKNTAHQGKIDLLFANEQELQRVRKRLLQIKNQPVNKKKKRKR